jgi:DNA end-binding protein Ku
MNTRAIWQGAITCSDVKLPVKLYSAVVDRNVHFHLLHKTDSVRLQQRMINPRTGEPVRHEEIRKGYPVEDRTLVLLDDVELDKLAPPPSREIEITRFVPSQAISLEWYHRPYFAAPTAESAKDYYAFASALARRDVRGIARWTMRKKACLGAFCAEDDHLVLVTLHSRGEVVSLSDLDPPSGRDLSSEERKLAEQLVKSLAGSFDPSEFHDEFQKRVRELVDAKNKGKTLRKPPHPSRRPIPKSLAESLRHSLRAVKS